MKYVLGALALLLAVPAAAQTAPATDPHAGHAQHGTPGKTDHSRHGGMDHAKMMEACKKGTADAKAEDCCEMMMKHHSAAAGAAAAKPGDQPQHSH